MISAGPQKFFLPPEETLGISTLNQGLIPSRKANSFEFIEVASGGKQRIIAAEKDAFGANDFPGDSVDEGTV
jgi:hypothetical protein